MDLLTLCTNYCTDKADVPNCTGICVFNLSFLYVVYVK